jgi:two-component system nitrogen regulation sensor histidine kinase NtrY
LLGANRQLHERRVFIEAVLESVTSGIVSLDPAGRILLMNSTAQKLLTDRAELPEDMPLAELAPQLAALIEQGSSGGLVQYNRNGDLLTFAVKVTRDVTGFVITFEDITRQLLDQRTAAWSDVARRIAHEIKNPLTPIQLSAERIRRRVSKLMEADEAGREVIDQCTDTIVRQVETIQHMVNEFSSFARMPKPAITEDNLADMVRKVVLDMRVGYPDLEIGFTAPREPVLAVFDRRLLSQALGNIIKNATEAVSAMAEEERGPGRIDVVLRSLPERIEIDVVDNGPGFPAKDRQRLLEPYMTTREKGTGLGLAIVGKILEEHGGGVELLDSPAVAEGGRGALVRLFLPVVRPQASVPAASPVPATT